MGKYDPAATREILVRAAYEEVHLSGIRAASLDGILSRAGVTKGALYHHFRNKHELCEAVIEEVIRPHVLGTWLAPLAISGDPIGTLQQILAQEAAGATPEQVKLGCPLNNLAQEVSSVDERFRERIEEIFVQWQRGIEQAIERGRQACTVRADVDPGKISRFFVASLEGAFGRAKSAHCCETLAEHAEVLSAFLDTLRAQN